MKFMPAFSLFLSLVAVALALLHRPDPVTAAAQVEAARLGLTGCRQTACSAPADRGEACGVTCWRQTYRYTFTCAGGGFTVEVTP